MKSINNIQRLFGILALAVIALTTPILIYGLWNLLSQAVLSLGISHFVWAIIFKKREKTLAFYLTLFLVCYVLIALSGQVLGAYYEFRLNQFDLDGDGFFSESEQTAEQERYMQLLTNDLGRNFLIFTGAVYSAIFTTAVYLLTKALAIVRRK